MFVTTRVRAKRAVVLASVAALTLVGCGEQVAAQAPTQRVPEATSSVLDTESLTVSVGLDLADADRTALTAAVEKEAAENETFDPAMVGALLDARIVSTMATTDGSLLSDATVAEPAAGGIPANISTSVAFVLDDEALVEVRQVAGSVYARADLAGLEENLQTSGLVEGVRGVTEQAPPQLAEAADALVTGGWVSMDVAAMTEQVKELSGAPAPTPAETDTQALTDALNTFLADAGAVLKREIEITEKGDDEFTVTAPLDRILQDLSPSLETVITDVAKATGTPMEGFDKEFDAGMTDAQKGLAGRTATLDVTLDGERLRTVRMDVAQFLAEADRAEMKAQGVNAIPVLVELSEDGSVQAPDGAVGIDLASLLSGAAGAGAAPGEGGADPFAGVTAEELGMTEDEFEAFKAEMGTDG